MKKKKFVVVDVHNLTPENLEERMNELHSQGYRVSFHSSIEWYQGKGMWGVVTFELREEGTK